jgi:hypothetical protein
MHGLDRVTLVRGAVLMTIRQVGNYRLESLLGVGVIDAATDKVIDTIKTGKQPTGIDFNGRQGYVTDEGSGTLEILNFPQ